MPNIPCALVLKDCLPCNDDPIRNITAEAPDVDVFIGFRDFKWNPPLGVTYFQLTCKSFCFSEVSQQDADLCALRVAEECVWNGGSDPIVPPIPPGPNSNGGKGGGHGLPPTHPRNPIRRFRNTVQTCDAFCPDGSPFTETVAAGTFIELSQALADAKAKSLACKLAKQHLFCISSTPPPAACVGDSYFFFLSTNSTEDLIWTVDGSLPPGLTFDFFDASITGTPTIPGSYTFVVEVTNASGQMQAKVLTICVMEIVTASPLPTASINNIYAEPLVQQPATVSSEVWTLVSGSLPTGITLASNGSLTGIPTEAGTSNFTLKVDATCDGVQASCQKAFTLEVSGVDCMGVAQSIGDSTWSNGMSGGDITVSSFHTPSTETPPVASVFICNPSLTPYAFTVDVSWTNGGAILITDQTAGIVLNGVQTLGPTFGGGAGPFVSNFSGFFASGVNQLDVILIVHGFFNGVAAVTITARPLTPP